MRKDAASEVQKMGVPQGKALLRSVGEIIETLKRAKERGKSCALLIGAGCSVKAGIPTADGFVEVIKSKHRTAYQRAKEKTYAQCMAELTLGERRDLIAEYVDKARINWAHVCIAILIHEGYVDRVYTTNFDPLVVRACALLGEFPAVYDFAASQKFKPADIPEKAVFYLHGQRSGFVLLNTEEECLKLSKSLGPVFEDAGQRRVWVIVGYSGRNDPVFDHLVKVPQFDNGLYWVGYQDEEPGEHVRQRLLSEGKDAYFTGGLDADAFLVSLTQGLKIFPPKLIRQPFSHLDEVLKTLTAFTIPRQVSEEDVTIIPRKWVKKAIREIEEPMRMLVEAQRLLMAGEYDRVVGLHKRLKKRLTPELTDILTWGYVMQGNALLDQAKMKQGEEADRLFALAGEKYAQALAIKPDKHEALYNWGVALSDQAEMKRGKEADRLFALAGEKYAKALAIKPDMHEALYNWGIAFFDQAKMKRGKEADRLFALAGEKYAKALAIKPDMHEALNNWGVALYNQAKMKRGKEADRLFAMAGEKYAQALAIKPDKQEALNNWGNALSNQAKMKRGKEADRLFAMAGEKYAQALAIKPDKQEALNNWGNALADQAKMKRGKEADRLFAMAGEKYAQALAIKPDKHEAFYNWGNVLSDQAMLKRGKEADRLFALAGEKYKKALAIKPDKHEALINWGHALLHQAMMKRGKEADRLFELAAEKSKKVLTIQPDSHAALSNWGMVLLHQSRKKGTKEARRLRALAKEKFAQAQAITKKTN